MPYNLERKNDYEVVLTQDISGDEWKQAQDEAFQNLKRSLNLRGFRKGRVPDHYARQVIRPEMVYQYAIDPVAQKALEQITKDIEIVDTPTLDYENPSREQVTLIFTLTTRPEFELPDYHNLDVEKESPELTDEEFEIYYNSRLQPYANWVVVDDTTAQNGDQLIIDAKNTQEEGPLAGYEVNDAEILMGAQPAYASVYEALEGMAPEETRTVVVPLQDGSVEVPFEVTLTEIQRKELPEVTDEFVKENNLGESAEDYTNAIREQAERIKKNRVDNSYVTGIMNALASEAEINFPQAMIRRRIQEGLNQQLAYMAQAGADVDELVAQIEADPEAYIAQFEPQAIADLTQEAILLAIAKAEGFEVEKDLDRNVANYQLMQQAIEFLKEL